MDLIYLVLELVILFFLSQSLTQSLFLVYLLLFRSKKVAVSLISLLLFPGTVVHELSHLFTAEILGVHTGRIELVPEFIDRGSLKTGSVAIAQTGPLRKALIGIAPIVSGLAALTALAYFLATLWPQITLDWQLGTIFNNYPFYLSLGLMYLVFAVSNSMFSSPADLKGTLPLAILLILIVSGGWLAGFRLTLTGTASNIANQILDSLTRSLGLVLGINLLLYIISLTIIRLLVKSKRLTPTNPLN